MNKNLGQFFTPETIVKQMVSLIENTGTILEPSCGDGAFLKYLPKNTIGIEIDPQFGGDGIITDDFFNTVGTYDTIIGNPPYIRYQDISPTTKALLPDVLDKRSNLYLFFMWKCIDSLNEGGELIFIVPRDFTKNTSALDLNKRLYTEGAFTYWEEHGDNMVFQNATPNTCIFRWVKGASTHAVPVEFNNGYLNFGRTESDTVDISLLFDVYVGGASGANDIFYNENGNIDLVCSSTSSTGETKRAFYVDTPNDYLLEHKEKLLSRKIRKFNNDNWYEWGRKIRYIDKPHIYVNMKTRQETPFYEHSCLYFDGSVLALIPKSDDYAIEYLVDCLNHNDWTAQGFKVGGRLIFGQRSLLNAKLKLL